ncbi:MAG: hypothetical protein K1X35_06885 [Caulobacteraceae bacterium]|nr:hypothetical protein [Caulobacteraceae bacterium]
MPTFLAVYVGEPTNGPPPELTPERMREGMQAWQDWGARHGDDIVFMGGPLGRTKKTSKSGVEDIRNRMGGFTIVRAESHEAAARMFENHPHFMIFPGDGVEVMPILDIPQTPD